MHGKCFSFKGWKDLSVSFSRGRRELSKPRFGALRTFRTKRSDSCRESVYFNYFPKFPEISTMLNNIQQASPKSHILFVKKWWTCVKYRYESRIGIPVIEIPVHRYEKYQTTGRETRSEASWTCSWTSWRRPTAPRSSTRCSESSRRSSAKCETLNLF